MSQTGFWTCSGFGPLQVLMQEVEGPDAVDGVRAGEPLELAVITNAELGFVEEADLGELVADRLIGRHAVEVAALDHERPGGDQGGHLGVVEGAPEVDLEDLVLDVPSVA